MGQGDLPHHTEDGRKERDRKIWICCPTSEVDIKN